MQRYLITDNARQVSVTLTLAAVLKRFDGNYSNDAESDTEGTFGDWLATAEVGDSYHNDDDATTFTRTR